MPTSPPPLPGAAWPPGPRDDWTPETAVTVSEGRASLAICVFCGAGNQIAGSLPRTYIDTAERLGEQIGRRGHQLVYGGGTAGLLGVVARAAQAAGGDVVGVILRGRFDHELINGPIGELITADTLWERKAEMVRRADAFVALPGGLGTLDELSEVVTQRQLGLHGRPNILVNLAGYWNPLLAMLRKMGVVGFAPTGIDQGALLHVVATAEQAIGRAEELVGQAAAQAQQLVGQAAAQAQQLVGQAAAQAQQLVEVRDEKLAVPAGLNN